MKALFLFGFFAIIASTPNLQAQKQIEYTSANIPPELVKNANAVVRLQETKIDIHTYKDLTVKKKRIVTVLNKYGDSFVRTYQFYDAYQKIISLEANVYDKNGGFVKRFKQKDFLDQSYNSGSIATDNRYYYIDYNASSYPYTLVFETESNFYDCIYRTMEAFKWTIRKHRGERLSVEFRHAATPSDYGEKF